MFSEKISVISDCKIFKHTGQISMIELDFFLKKVLSVEKPLFGCCLTVAVYVIDSIDELN